MTNEKKHKQKHKTKWELQPKHKTEWKNQPKSPPVKRTNKLRNKADWTNLPKS